jgi:hypothetical protein
VVGDEAEGPDAARSNAFARRYGMRELELWAMLAGSTFWLPLILGDSVLRGVPDAWGFLLLAVPYVAIVHWLLLCRRRTPITVWSGYLALGLGGYAVYLWVLLHIVRGGGNLLWLAGLGALGLVVGYGRLHLCAKRARQLPRLEDDVVAEDDQGTSS